ncbi:MAG: efflux RND transporter periplasmic adaptor subunit [Bacteroidaceae bacterium]|nr:efflux RND transporter periplasmic adaptor subunit [Bacteroidaceae bacterium]
MKKRDLLAVAVIAAIFTACTGGQKAQDAKSLEGAKPKVRLATVYQSAVDQVRDYTCTVEAEVKNNIAPQAMGRISKIYVEVGDHVVRGQRLVQMDASSLRQLELQIANQKTDFERIEKLYKIGGVSKAEYDNAKMSLDVNETSYANLKENTQLLSPITGIVTARNYDNGDLYSGSPVLTIQQIRPVKLLINVSEQYFSRVKKGDIATIRLDALPDKQYVASVKLVYPTINASTHTFPVELSLPNSDEAVRPGMFARATLNFGTEQHVVVPDQAIVKQPGSGERFVYTYNADGTVSYMKVELGQRLGDSYELLSGVPDGARIVIAGQSKLVDGAAVQVVE